ncbi:MAG: serine/threonine protein kinase [Deltaproteobacteria bacterium]|nr:serine/threonine protein kinase [Deltaproteobacteria bacterium]MDQ3296940.1 protein kinase [Myxococcota bacterium]
MDGAPSHFCSRCGTRRSGKGTCARDGTTLTAIVDSSLLGTEVGNYVIVQALGQGGMGAVYRAVQPAIGAEVAIKVLHAGSEAQSGMVQRFLLEAQAVNRVRHPGLIKILDTGYLPDRRPYLVMELLDGASLADAIGQLAPALACHVVAEALDALQAVHQVGIVHRDLKPPNVFLTRDGRVVVLDFGIAKLVATDGGAAITHSTGLIGTPEYMAPEQIRSRPLDRRTDIYAMGILLYELITGKRPFAAAATFELLVQHVERPPTSPRDYVPDLAPAITDTILRALEKEADRRFQTAAEMAAPLRVASGASNEGDVAAFVASRVSAAARVLADGDGAGRSTLTIRGPGGSARDAVPTAAYATTAPQNMPVPDSTQPRARTAGTTRPDRRTRWSLLAGAAAVAATLAVVTVFIIMRDDAPVRADRPRGRDTGAAAAILTDAATTSAVPPVDAAATGTLAVKSNPPGARITVDHAPAGVTPATLSLAAGAHLIRVEHPGYLAVDEAAEVRAGERATVMVRLPEDRGPIAGRGNRPGSATTVVTKHGSGSADTAVTAAKRADPVPIDAGVPATTPRDAGSGSRRKMTNPYE